jgi:dTDP-4-dehydrorhamnose reductase
VKVLVTGKEGQVARSLAVLAKGRRDIELVSAARPELDLARPETIAPVIQAARPDIVISAAAYTAVDQAEDEPDLAFAVNATGAGEVARAAAAIGAPVIHLSTDYVFDGKATRPYREDVATNPQGAYGASKLAGEKAVAAANPRHVIVRTAWVYSPFGKNFVKTMLRLAETRDEIAVVSDQWGNPTSAHDIAEGLLVACVHIGKGGGANLWGTYHLAGAGDASWADFAEDIFKVSMELRGPSANVRRIKTSDYPTPARRPANSRLDIDRFLNVFGYASPRWRDSVSSTVGNLLKSS